MNNEEDEPKVTQEDIGTRIILTRKGEEILVDDDYDGEYFATCFNWYVVQTAGELSYVIGYRRALTGEKRENIYLHHLVAGPPTPSMKGLIRIFKNGNRLDCRSTNIAWATPSEVFKERKLWVVSKRWKGDENKYRGVNKVNGYERWFVYFRGVYVGSFKSPEEAAEAYDEEASMYYGDRAVLNFPDSYK